MIRCDIVVIGGGHAGIEAANSAARMGMSVLLITANVDLIGQMSCNPAIGGIAKGNIVREIDALGGLMGRIIDRAGIHFRMLNRSKGFAVWGNRAQADKALYRAVCRTTLEKNRNIRIFQGMVVEVVTRNGKACGIDTEMGERIESKAVICAMGTFLNGLVHIGRSTFCYGRLGEPPSLRLSESIQVLGIKAGRLKTGTPARVDGRTVDFTKMEIQKGDDEPWPFSFSTEAVPVNRAACWITRTTKQTHEIIRQNLHLSALYGGKIKSIGPRYCPSIEDKIVRFGDRNGHTLFLEPEGLDHQEMYLNGLSTSLPYEIQELMIHSIPGLEKVKIIRPAYAIEYDYFFPYQLRPTLESKIIENLYFTGQINGTSGYEEAGCQGQVAGINAAEKINGGEEFILPRSSSYTGVLIDDLVTKGTEEPYRMFTSRAEHRLLLRQDNADERLMPMAEKRGLIEPHIIERRKKIWERKARLIEQLATMRIKPEAWNAHHEEEVIQQKISAKDLLKRPKVSINDVIGKGADIERHRDVLLGAEADIKYHGFIQKQTAEIERQKKMEETQIPSDIEYDQMEGVLHESKVKLKKFRPLTLGQAMRISGITPADISVLIMHITKKPIHVSRET